MTESESLDPEVPGPQAGTQAPLSPANPGSEGRRKNRGLTLVIILLVLAVVVVALLLIVFRPTVVPDVTLKSEQQATAAIETAGLALGETSALATSAVGPGLVAAQSPSPLARAARRSSVDITLAVSPTTATVPDLVGLSEDAATAKLTDALYLAQPVDIFDDATEKGTVIAQLPGAGAEWMTGRPVAIAVAAGPDDGSGVAVPDVSGDSPVSALDALAKVGLAGYGIVPNPSSMESTRVTRQIPEGGVLVRPGTTVLLLFELP